MRLNAVPLSIVTPPETSPQVGDVRPTSPIGPQTPRPGANPPPLAQPGAEPVPQVPTEERRELSRRGQERRKQQAPVLIDTRVAERRRRRRRASDDALPAVDLEA